MHVWSEVVWWVTWSRFIKYLNLFLIIIKSSLNLNYLNILSNRIRISNYSTRKIHQFNWIFITFNFYILYIFLYIINFYIFNRIKINRSYLSFCQYSMKRFKLWSQFRIYQTLYESSLKLEIKNSINFEFEFESELFNRNRTRTYRSIGFTQAIN